MWPHLLRPPAVGSPFSSSQLTCTGTPILPGPEEHPGTCDVGVDSAHLVDTFPAPRRHWGAARAPLSLHGETQELSFPSKGAFSVLPHPSSRSGVPDSNLLPLPLCPASKPDLNNGQAGGLPGLHFRCGRCRREYTPAALGDHRRHSPTGANNSLLYRLGAENARKINFA